MNRNGSAAFPNFGRGFSKLVHTKRYHFWFSLKGSKVNVPQVAIFDKNMAVGNSKNLGMLHVHKLEKDHATFF